MKAGTVTYDPNHEAWGTQIGAGTYTTPGRDDYEPWADPDSWYATSLYTISVSYIFL